jgi:aspartyl-tRNA(Asn)/glutamyl-tRNA(Gln) amidotransferase subunit C
MFSSKIFSAQLFFCSNPTMDQEQVKKVAHLARLDLSPQEIEKFTGQLGSILEYVEQLSELDVTDVPPTTRAIDVSNVLRRDQLQPFSERERILAITPDSDGDFLRVPKIIAES